MATCLVGSAVKRLKVLMSAYACEPGKGSEPGVGWETVVEMSHFHDVWVITRANNQTIIESYLSKKGNLEPRFVYFDFPRWVSFWKKGPRCINLYYYMWQIGIYFVAKRLIKSVKFDLVHHVTFGKYWVPCFLSLLPFPFVWGVVGGGETVPESFYKNFSLKSKIFEKSRIMARFIGEHDPFVRITARRSNLAMAATSETKKRLVKLGAKNTLIVPQTAFNFSNNNSIASLSKRPDRELKIIRFISIGRFTDWKGFHLGLQAFHKAGIRDSEYWIVVRKKDKKELKKLVSKLGIAHKVKIFFELPELEDVYRALVKCDVLMHPALHEAFGTVVLEAMVAGKPVICLDRGGPALQVSEKSGIKITSKNPTKAIDDMADAMRKFWKNPDLILKMGAAGHSRAKEYFAWNRRRQWLNFLYHNITQNKPIECKYFVDI